MLDGIEVLSKVEIMDFSGWCSVIGLVAFCLVLILFVIVGMVKSKELEDMAIYSMIGCLAGLIIYLIIMALGSTVFRQPTGEYKYKVTISEDVNFKDFNDKYEVIGHEGKIYTIIEKDTVNSEVIGKGGY